MNKATDAAGIRWDHTSPDFSDHQEPDYEGYLIEQGQTLAAAGDYAAITPAMIDAMLSELRTLSYLHYKRDMEDGYLRGDDCPF